MVKLGQHKTNQGKKGVRQLLRVVGKRKVVVIMGGLSAEREISLLTGRAMFDILRKHKLNVRAVDVKTQRDILKVVNAKPAVVVNGLHGPGGEDGIVQGLFAWFDIPCTGAGVLGSALAMNKHLAKQVMRSAGIPTADWILVSPGDPVPSGVKVPVVVKPNKQGSAIGVAIVKNKKGIRPALEKAARFGDAILFERYLPGREISVGVLNGEALPVIEIIPKNDFYDYEAKYVAGMSEHIVPAKLSPALTTKAQRLAEQTARLLQCEGTPRIDMIVSPQGKINVLEVNTLPGMTATSLLPDAARASGLTFAELVLSLVCQALGGKQ